MINLEDNPIKESVKKKMTKRDQFRLILLSWRATINTEAKMRPMGSDQSDLHEILSDKIYEYFKKQL